MICIERRNFQEAIQPIVNEITVRGRFVEGQGWAMHHPFSVTVGHPEEMVCPGASPLAGMFDGLNLILSRSGGPPPPSWISSVYVNKEPDSVSLIAVCAPMNPHDALCAAPTACAMLHVFLACKTGKRTGPLSIMVPYVSQGPLPKPSIRNSYSAGIRPYPMVANPDEWLRDARMFSSEMDQAMGYSDLFFRRVAMPLLRAERELQRDTPRRRCRALDAAAECAAEDWREAMIQHIEATCPTK